MNASVDKSSQQVEHTKWSWGLLGFYASCAGVSIGAAVGFGGYKFFDSTPTLIGGLGVSIVSCITCFFTLRAARRPPGSPRP